MTITEIHENRLYTSIASESSCDFCPHTSVWNVEEMNNDYDTDTMVVCETHKYLAFS